MTGTEKAARLQKALDYGGNSHSIGDIVELLKRGDAKLFENDSGVIVAELHRFPRFTATHFWLLAGALKPVLALEDDVLAWGIENGATRATACGRKGWGRASASTGWKEWECRNFYKDLA
jgi:hypothetical protein